MQVNRLWYLVFVIWYLRFDSGNFYAKGGASGGAPAFDDTHHFVSLPVPLKGPWLLGIGMA